MKAGRSALVFACRCDHGVARHLHGDAVGLFALPAVKIDKKSQGEPKNVIMGAFGGHYDIKQVVVVDMDVNIDDEAEIEWAIAPRFQVLPTSSLTIVAVTDGWCAF